MPGRVVYNKSWWDRNVSPTALLKELHWDELKTRRFRLRMAMMYNITHQHVAVPPNELISAKSVRRHRNYQSIRTNHDTTKYSFYPRSIREWNKLDSNIVDAPSVAVFKERLTKAGIQPIPTKE